MQTTRPQNQARDNDRSTYNDSADQSNHSNSPIVVPATDRSQQDQDRHNDGSMNLPTGGSEENTIDISINLRHVMQRNRVNRISLMM